MANGFSKAWNYVSAWFGAQVDDKADPRIQIQQAMAYAQQQNIRLTQQAASVIGNEKQLEIKLDRQLAQVEELQKQTKQALTLADAERAKGNEERAVEFETTATALANQLVVAEQAAGNLNTLHGQAVEQARQARLAVADSQAAMQEKMMERNQLLSQLEQAKMQEQIAATTAEMSAIASPKGIPTLEDARDKIERRYALALGSAELSKDSTAGRMLEVKKATASLAGAERLAQIRKGMQELES